MWMSCLRQCNKAGEEEAGEGQHVVGDEVGLGAAPHGAGVACAVSAISEPSLVRGPPH